MIGVGDEFDNFRWAEFQKLVQKHGGTVIARYADHAKIRFGDDVLNFAYVGGDQIGGTTDAA